MIARKFQIDFRSIHGASTKAKMFHDKINRNIDIVRNTYFDTWLIHCLLYVAPEYLIGVLAFLTNQSPIWQILKNPVYPFNQYNKSTLVHSGK